MLPPLYNNYNNLKTPAVACVLPILMVHVVWDLLQCCYNNYAGCSISGLLGSMPRTGHDSLGECTRWTAMAHHTDTMCSFRVVLTCMCSGTVMIEGANDYFVNESTGVYSCSS